MTLRYLDFLLKDAVEAAVLTRYGALVQVPAPERYAVHKLIVSVMRKADGPSAVKADKDIVQAGLLIDALVAKRREDDLAASFIEAVARGASWRRALLKASTRLDERQQEFVHSIVR